MEKQYYVYILTNYEESSLYVGMTNNLIKRVFEHKIGKGHTAKYKINRLVYYEIYQDPESAIKREKQIKAGSRQKKIDLTRNLNPEWKDLYEEII